jgi:hypothetical protein
MAYVRHNGQTWLTTSNVLKWLGLYAGQSVGSDMMWRVIAENGAQCVSEVAKTNPAIDTTELAALVEYTRMSSPGYVPRGDLDPAILTRVTEMVTEDLARYRQSTMAPEKDAP